MRDYRKVNLCKSVSLALLLSFGIAISATGCGVMMPSGNSGINSGIDSGTNSGINAGMNSETNSGTNSGTNSDAGSEIDQSGNGNRVDTGFTLYGPDAYDSADLPVLLQKDTENKTITFLNLDLGQRYTLSYDGTTRFLDKYGKALSLEQLAEGDLVDVKFVKGQKHLTSMQKSPDVWTFASTTEYAFNHIKKEVTIGEDTYRLSNEICYMSDRRPLDEMDINESDILTFQGIGSTIYSVVVEKGHGYLRLNGIENFVGGWIEVGTSLITRVKEDMLLTVPEGTYGVKISAGGTISEKQVSIEKNRESSLNFGDVEIAAPKIGQVLFSLSPVDAELYVDGEIADPSAAISMTYGIHQLICRASGYQSVTQYLRVGQATAGIDIKLDPLSSNTESDSDADTSSAIATGYYQVHIDEPAGVEVFLDGAYVGVAPCSFRKVAGSHVVTLSKTGYVTRSYTISVDEEEKDISFSFVNLVSESEEGGTSSGNGETGSNGSAGAGETGNNGAGGFDGANNSGNDGENTSNGTAPLPEDSTSSGTEGEGVVDGEAATSD